MPMNVAGMIYHQNVSLACFFRYAKTSTYLLNVQCLAQSWPRQNNALDIRLVEASSQQLTLIKAIKCLL